MDPDDFSKFEWHDLPVERLSIADSGFELIVTPWNEASSNEDRYRLALEDASAVEFEVTGNLSPQDWSDLEVYSLDLQSSEGSRISGKLGILPGQAGFRVVTFIHARWTLEQLPAGGSDAAA